MRIAVFAILFIAAIVFALYFIFKPITEDRKARKNITNFDSLMQNYCFMLSCSQAEAISQLSAYNVLDVLAYTFDTHSFIITFSHLGVSISYQLSFYEVNGTTYLKVGSCKFLHGSSNIPYMVNPFFIEKLHAVPVDYTAFTSTICTAAANVPPAF